MKKYDHHAIEKKWQNYWKKHKTFKVEIDPSKPKYYILDMFPYPSGAGLHVGHVTGYTGSDILSRYKRHLGFNVLHPMGWDSFGLPAEQYAIRTGTHPSITTEKNINTYRKQLQSLGFSYDWDREVATSDSSYYKWTQWIFTEIFKQGLTYEAEVLVNYCPALGTVLANEEVENGRAKEGGYPVERKPLRQWIMKITAYADRLISDLDLVDWPENLKRLQINWIGKSEGGKIRFKTDFEEITVFTTRPDTLFGCTYIVLSPEHPLVSTLTTSSQKKEVEDYLSVTTAKSDLERTDLSEEKTGVFTGSYALHPITQKRLPIWISDYVLVSYGTGAVMAVPSHDERDFAFAEKYKLPIICVFDPDLSLQEDPGSREEILSGKHPWEKDGIAINSSYKDLDLNGLNSREAKERILNWLEKNQKGERGVSYKLRDWLFSRQRYWGEPIPILHFADGTKRALDIDELPLLPPALEDYRPSGGGESPLAKVKEWVEVFDSKTKKPATRETNTMPQWAGSCWYYLRFCDPQNSNEAFSEEAEKYWMNVDLYIGGAEHAVLHLLYARFWHKILYDLGFVSTVEPFQTYRYQGVVTAPSFKKKAGGYVHPEEVKEINGKYFYEGEEVLYQIEKMSKSKLNGSSPDEIIEEFGADALRLYEMFMGPFDREKIWNTDAVNGCKRFLNRLFDLVHSDKIVESSKEEALRLGHRLVQEVTKDIETMQFNTAIAHMMEFLNAFSKLSCYPKEVLKMVITILHPFAPHIAEELYEYLGGKPSLANVPWPKVDPAYLVEEVVNYVIQINGKLRACYSLKKGFSEEDLFAKAKEDPQVQKYIKGTILKRIFIPDKLLNIVVE